MTYNYTLYVIRKLCDVIKQKTKVCHGLKHRIIAPYNPSTWLFTYNYKCIIMHIYLTMCVWL